MIVKNEQAVLARCLGCVKQFADSIVVVDTGSDDDTVEIARSFTPRVYSFDWCDDFSAARNFSFEQADGDYVMWIDADDVVTQENIKKILALKESGGFDVAFLKYRGGSNLVYYRERIFRRSLHLRWKGAVHEAISPVGKIIYSDAEILHAKLRPNAPMRNLNIYQKQIASGVCLDERDKYYYGRELFYNRMYRESIAVLNDFLRGGGWVQDKKQACRVLHGAHLALGEEQAALSALFSAFAYGAPGSEDCCLLGWHFFQKGDNAAAAYWYRSALLSPESERDGGFVNPDCQAFIPYLQLCVIYDRLGDYAAAERYNELAGEIKPNDASYLANKQYFDSKKHSQ